MSTMTFEVKSFDSPDEVRPFAGHGHIDLINMHGHEVSMGVFEPGWKWSNDVKPIAQTESCEFEHFGFIMSGSMRVTLDDGTVRELNAGDLYVIPPKHDAEVIGSEACVMLDFGGEDADYAKPD